MSVNTRVLVQNAFEFIYAEHVFSLVSLLEIVYNVTKNVSLLGMLTHLLIFQIFSCIVQ